MTKKDVYPMPRMDVLGEGEFFSSMDATSGFHQIPIDEESREKTAFACSEGLFEFNRLSMGLANAPAIFNRYMHRVLGGLMWQCVLVYVDDILVFSKTFDAHLKDLEKVFERVAAYGMHLKPEKCFFDPRWRSWATS